MWIEKDTNGFFAVMGSYSEQSPISYRFSVNITWADLVYMDHKVAHDGNRNCIT